jgi:Tfp pilus assembly protein PilZ
MKKLIRIFMSLIGEKNRHKIYRKLAVVPKDYLSPEYRVEIARTQADLESAYALLHDCYVGIKIIDPQPSGLRCNVFSFLPTSTIIIVKKGDRVVGTVSAIKDSSAGLPSDKDFLVQNDQFRRENKILIEASALAVSPECRGDHSVSFLLMKFLYHYCCKSFQGHYMVAAVHPRAEDFYKALWKFERNGKPLHYGTLKGAAAIHISMDLSHEHFQKIVQDFRQASPLGNLAAMVAEADSRFHYPEQKACQSIFPVITPEMLKYFCLEQSEVWARMSSEEKEKLLQVYSTYFGPEAVEKFKEGRFPTRSLSQDYRTPLRLTSVLSLKDNAVFCEILDLTSKGCFVQFRGELPAVGQAIRISFFFAEQKYSLQAAVVWQNKGQTLKQPRGVGLQFAAPLRTLNSQLQQWLYGNRAATSEIHPQSDRAR